MNLLTIGIAGAVLWGVLFVLRRVLDRSRIPSSFRARFKMVLPAMVFVLWVAFAFWAGGLLFGSEPFFPWLAGGAVGILLLLFGWFVLRDIVAGVVFTSRNPNILRHRLTIGNVRGAAVRLGVTNLYLRTDSGETLSIPYSKVAGETTAEHVAEHSTDRYRMRIPLGEEVDPEAARSAILRGLFLTAWVNQHIPPTVLLTTEGEETYAEVSYHCLNKRHAMIVEGDIRRMASSFDERN